MITLAFSPLLWMIWPSDVSASPATTATSISQGAATLPTGSSDEFHRRMLDWTSDPVPAPLMTREKIGVTEPARPGRLAISSGFGWRDDPINGVGRRHDGVDLPGRSGSRVMATAGGVVRIAGWVRGYGNLVEIAHAGGIETRYGHLESIRVSRGQRVSKGQLIGDLGSTGHSTGPHLHYEVRVGGVAVNPQRFLGQSTLARDPDYSTAWAPEARISPKWTGWAEPGMDSNALPEARIR